MDSEFFAKVRAVAAASVSMKPKTPLPPMKLAWRVKEGFLEVLWPNGSPWVRYKPESPVSDALVARVASEAFRRMHHALGVATTVPFLAWLVKGDPLPGADGVASLPLFFFAEVITFDPKPDLSLDVLVLPPA